MKTAETADEFLACAADFQLGPLETEQPHPLTANLSSACTDDLPTAIESLKAVDVSALTKLVGKIDSACELANSIANTWQSGGRVFLAGCGATGRLSLALETFCRQGMIPEKYHGQVIGLMAGGDAALIRSIEGFEDFPEYGARQLRDLGFGENDLLIASTEGGETPWVIGATAYATDVSRRTPWFCYCNPDAQLCERVERSRRILDDPAIRKWNLAVGPMAIAGSTRMQASTALQFGIGLALDGAGTETVAPHDYRERLIAFQRQVIALDWQFLAGFIEREAEVYQRGDRMLYITNNFGLTVLTDTTERSPTFSLPVFENYQGGKAQGALSLCYLSLPEERRSRAAWGRLLQRDPRCLDWPTELPLTRLETLLGYDISSRAADRRALSCGDARHHGFSIDEADGAVVWSLGNTAAQATPAGLPILEKQTLLKILLNAHSTLVMGRLGRYEGNVMTYVKPANNKLIDRAIRYVQSLHLQRRGVVPRYETVCRELFLQRESLAPDEPIVLKTLAALKSKFHPST